MKTFLTAAPVVVLTVAFLLRAILRLLAVCLAVVAVGLVALLVYLHGNPLLTPGVLR